MGYLALQAPTLTFSPFFPFTAISARGKLFCSLSKNNKHKLLPNINQGAFPFALLHHFALALSSRCFALSSRHPARGNLCHATA